MDIGTKTQVPPPALAGIADKSSFLILLIINNLNLFWIIERRPVVAQIRRSDQIYYSLVLIPVS